MLYFFIKKMHLFLLIKFEFQNYHVIMLAHLHMWIVELLLTVANISCPRNISDKPANEW
jgi:hypothetical protein